MMRSLVIGASGVVGGYIVKRLVDAGHRPLALSRRERHSSQFDWLLGDLSDAGALTTGEASTLYCTVDIWLLAEAMPAIATPTLKRVVAFTSTSIETKMNSEIRAERELLQRLAEGERRLATICRRLGIAWTILRPTLIYAEGKDNNVSRIARLIKRFGVLPLMGRGSGLRQPVHAEDLAIGAIAAAQSKAAANRTYAVPGGEILSYREMVGRIFDALGRPRRIVSVPPSMWRAGFLLATPFVRNANVAMGKRMSKDMVFDTSPAAKDFGWAPRTFHPRFDLS